LLVSGARAIDWAYASVSFQNQELSFIPYYEMASSRNSANKDKKHRKGAFYWVAGELLETGQKYLPERFLFGISP
jgi:hypothetical protein